MKYFTEDFANHPDELVMPNNGYWSYGWQIYDVQWQTKKAIGFERRLLEEETADGTLGNVYLGKRGFPSEYALWFKDAQRSLVTRVAKVSYKNKRMVINNEHIVYHPDVPVRLHFLRMVCEFMKIDLSEWIESAEGARTTIRTPTNTIAYR